MFLTTNTLEYGGYVSNRPSRTIPLVTRKKQVLLLIETSRAYGRGLIEGVAKYASEQDDWSIHFEDRSLHEHLPSWLKHWKGDGIIARTTTTAQRQSILQLGVPYVELFGTHAPEVGCDDTLIAQMAMEHFITHGIRHFAFFAPDMQWWCRHRFERFQQVLQDSGYPCACFKRKKKPGNTLSPSWDVSGDRELRNWLLELPKPTGLFAATDVYSLTVLGACQRAGIRVPGEIAILGADNDHTICLSVTPQLSSIDVNNVLTGYTAAELLHERMTLPKQQWRATPLFTPPAYIVPRQSTDIAVSNDEDIVKAIELIRKNAIKGITVMEVAESVCLSLRTLRRRFKKHIGRSPEKEIIDIRINVAKQYLRETILPVYIVSQNVGFNAPEYFVKAFKKEVGLTPVQYRKKYQMGTLRQVSE